MKAFLCLCIGLFFTLYALESDRNNQFRIFTRDLGKGFAQIKVNALPFTDNKQNIWHEAPANETLHFVSAVQNHNTIALQDAQPGEATRLMHNHEAAPASITSPEWRQHATPEDTESISNARLIIDEANQQNFHDWFGANDKKELVRLQQLLTEPDLSIDVSQVIGKWKCRSTQLNNTGIYVYNYFNCQITKSDNKLFFEKTSGSQRKSGYLFPNGNNELVFLGGWTVNDDPQTVYSGLSQSTDNQNDTVGIFVRKSNKLVALFPYSKNHYEIYELIR